ncbi:outer membrane protein assembly factor BamB family protein [Halorubrum ezzemoulense]|nr:PQQ-binding-like beta-propeller repeat protein [Halorubrum ezzemoulense]
MDISRIPVVTTDRILISCNERQIKAFDFDGNGCWAYTHPNRNSAYNVSWSYLDGPGSYDTNPVIADGSVYYVVNDRCVSLSLADGTIEWELNLPTSAGVPVSGVLVADEHGDLYICYTDSVCKVSRNGAVDWVEKGDDVGSVLVSESEERVIYKYDYNKLCCIDASTGTEYWTHTERGEDVPGSGELLHQNRLYLNHFNVPAVRAIDVQSGDVKWSLNEEYQQIHNHSPTGTLFGIDNEGRLDAIDNVTGSTVWTTNLVSKATPIRSTTDSLYISENEQIIRCDPYSGAIEERSPQFGFEINDFIIDHGSIIAAGNDTITLLSGQRSSDSERTQAYSHGSGDDERRCPACDSDLSGYGDLNFCPECGTKVASSDANTKLYDPS